MIPCKVCGILHVHIERARNENNHEKLKAAIAVLIAHEEEFHGKKHAHQNPLRVDGIWPGTARAQG